MSRHFLAILTIVTILPSSLIAQTAGKADNSIAVLAGTLKPILIDSLPNKLYEKSDNWDHQVPVPVGLKWRGLRAEVTRSPRNHGEWRKMRIEAQDLKRTLDLRLSDLRNVDAEKQTFKTFLTFQMGVEYEQQNWESGVRLWSGSIRARAQVKFDLDCENTIRFEAGKEVLPDVVLRVRVTNARVDYDKLVVEHVNGMGGDGAKLIGGTIHKAMKQWRPSIERDLLEKASAAIVKTADTREVRLSFGSLIKSK